MFCTIVMGFGFFHYFKSWVSGALKRLNVLLHVLFREIAIESHNVDILNQHIDKLFNTFKKLKWNSFFLLNTCSNNTVHVYLKCWKAVNRLISFSFLIELIWSWFHLLFSFTHQLLRWEAATWRPRSAWGKTWKEPRPFLLTLRSCWTT